MKSLEQCSVDLVDLDRWRYLARGVLATLSPRRPECPACGNVLSTVLKRQYLVTALVMCNSCKLRYRTPVDPRDYGRSFYQQRYQAGFATDCPSVERLAYLRATAFRGSSMDFANRLDVLRALGVKGGARILDFGASWGYGTWQFNAAGYAAVGFEISVRRAAYARENLGVRVEHDLHLLGGDFDVFFSSHVLEHLPSPRFALDEAAHRLKQGGLFLAFTPNGSQPFLDCNPLEYHKYWGRIHGLYVDDAYYRHALPHHPKLLCSAPNDTAYDNQAIAHWSKTDDLFLDLRFSELCAVIVY